MIVAGVGFRPGCAIGEIGWLLREAERLAGQSPALLAVPWFRAEAAMLAGLGLPVVMVDRESLRAVQPRCPTRSERALQAHGIASVAEGCALAAAGTGAMLVLARIASANATCALAEGASA